MFHDVLQYIRMERMDRKDTLNSLVIGFLVAGLLLVLKYSGNIDQLKHIPYLESSLIAFPILALMGLRAAALLQKNIPFAFRGAKFTLVGALNTFLDLGILNLLVAATGITAGVGFSLFKAFSFLFAIANSYAWNKHWTFRSKKHKNQDFLEQSKEMAEFFTVSGIGFVLNVGTASAVVTFMDPQFGLAERAWPTVAAIAGTLVVFTWNFLGYRFIVFKKQLK